MSCIRITDTDPGLDRPHPHLEPTRLLAEVWRIDLKSAAKSFLEVYESARHNCAFPFASRSGGGGHQTRLPRRQKLRGSDVSPSAMPSLSFTLNWKPRSRL